MHLAPSRRSRAGLVMSSAVAGLAASAVTPVLASAATTGTGDATPHNTQVALVNGTDAQPASSSALNGTAQVTSHDGQFVVFSTVAALTLQDGNDTDDVYLRDTADGITVLVSHRNGFAGNDSSFEPTISADGRYVAFTTFATNLNGDDIDQHALQVVVKDMQTGRLETASVTRDGVVGGGNSFAPVISDDGRSVSFQSFVRFGRKDQDRREDVYVRDLDRDVTRQGSLNGRDRDVRSSVLNGDLSGDGSVVVFGNDNKLWARNVETGTTKRFWREPDAPPCQPFPAGSAGRPAISGNGRFVAFASCATKLPGEDGAFTDVYRMELATGKIRVAHPAGTEGHSYLPSLSRSGRFVGFGSEARLVPGDTATPDAFVADMREGVVRRASQAPDGTAGNEMSATNDVAISGNGRALAYVSYASNLVEGDTSDFREAFLWHR